MSKKGAGDSGKRAIVIRDAALADEVDARDLVE